MAYIIQTGLLGSQPIADTSTTQNHPLGHIVTAVDATLGSGEFIYLKGATSTVVGSWVTYNSDDWTTTLLAANAIGPVAVAMSANAAATSYGWYQIHGKAAGKVNAAVDDNDNVYCSTLAGSVNDVAVTGDRVWGAKAASATTGAGTIDVEIARPFVNDGLNAGTS